jgi:hypothetical protein
VPGRTLYHYTSASAAIEYILPEPRLRLGAQRDSNDPAEDALAFYGVSAPPTPQIDPARFNASLRAAHEHVFGGARILSTTRDDESVAGQPLPLNQLLGNGTTGRGFARDRMWAQYADNHAGICLFLDEERLRAAAARSAAGAALILGDVTYSDLRNPDAWALDLQRLQSPPATDYFQEMRARYAADYYLRKRLDWSTEAEVRLVLLPPSPTQYVFVNIREALVGMCVGHRFKDVYRPVIAESCQRLKVPAYKISYGTGLMIGEYARADGGPVAVFIAAGF